MTALLLAAALAAPPPPLEAPALPSPMTLAQAEDIFLSHGLDLLVAEANARGAAGDLAAAGAHPNPGANVGGLYSFAENFGAANPNNSPAVWGWTAGVTDNAAIEDQLSGKRSLRIEAAAQALAAAKQSVADLKRNELSQLRQAFAAALLAQDNLEFARDVDRSYEKTLKLDQIRYQKGDISEADLAKIAVAKLEADQVVTQAGQGFDVAKTALAFLLGARGKIPVFAIAGSLAYAEPQGLAGKSPDDLLALGEARRPDLEAAVASRKADEALLTQARRLVLPDLALSLTYLAQALPSYVVTPPSLELGVSGNLPVFYQQQGEIQRAEANLDTARDQEAKVRAQIASDVGSAWAGYRATGELVRRMEGEELNQAKLSRDLEELMYQKGAASLLDYLDAERTYTAVNLEYHQDLAAYWTAVYQLEQATATPLR